MAIFQTGAATSAANLLDIVAAFAVANGWTQTFNAVEGAGRRVHLQLDSDVFINFRSLNNEYPNTITYGSLLHGLALNGSTGYDSGASWCRQPGAPKPADAANVFMAGIGSIGGAVPAYYLFAREDIIYCWVEYATGLWQWFYFGRVTKVSTWTGGMIFGASGSAVNGDNVAALGILAGQPAAGLITPVTGNPNGYLYGVIDGATGWMRCTTGTATVPAMPTFFDSMCKQAVTFINLSNTFNSQPVLPAIEICITRDGTGVWQDNANFSIEAVMPDLYFCNMRTLLAGQQLDDGSGDTFRVFPFYQKGASGLSNNWAGVAIKEN